MQKLSLFVNNIPALIQCHVR